MDMDAAGDFVDRARAGWEKTRPGLDVSSIEVMGRISRIGALASQRVERGLAAAEVSRAEFDVLCALARSDRPLRASEVTVATMLSGASTTKNVDRLAKRGHVERLPWERDGRVVLIQLTAAGAALVNREFPHMLALDMEALAGLDAGERTLLAGLLRKVTARVEPAG